MTEAHTNSRSNRIMTGAANGIDLISALMLALLTAVVFLEVFSRYVFSLPLVYSNELTLLLFPWMIFIAGVSVTFHDNHLAITFVRRRMPPKIQHGMFLFSKLVMLFFAVMMTYASWMYTENQATQVMPVLRISRGWLSTSMMIAFALISLVLIYHIVQVVRGRMSVPREEEELDAVDDDR
ncbi:TRAP transporter small permease [Alkalicoccus chagannorensis]|uniref:TRAP transporter small permease n=1 Tax=Alkalicoccus chagannorensis TaxID=427072 RepID=UPI000421058F|nr:TRAP transporter small permease [Alkalicoccus chagannorensis]